MKESINGDVALTIDGQFFSILTVGGEILELYRRLFDGYLVQELK